jgi:RHS repeat-associated protein
VSTGHACSSTSATGDVLYEHDDDGNRTRVDEDNGATSADYRYCHDALDQLIARKTASACTSSPTETATYDDAGNRTQWVSGGVTTNQAYTAAGVLCDVETGSAASCTGGNVGVDDAGRLSSYAGYTFLYDAQGRLVSACDDADCVGSGFRRIDFAYDGEGHRTEIVETPAVGSAVTTTFRYQGHAVVAEYRDGTLYREYLTDEAGTISKVTVPIGQTGAGTYLVTWNGHGDAMALWRVETNGSLTLANSYTYSSWGLPTTATHNSIADLGFRFLYVGAHDVQWDGTYGLPLIYMHARHYSPTIGRFLQPDPSRLDARLFVYAENSPVSKVDAGGTCAMTATAERDWMAQVAACILQGAATGVRVGLGVGVFIITLPFLVSGDTVRKVPVTKTMPRTSERKSTKGCWVIGEVQDRVRKFAASKFCATMWDLPSHFDKQTKLFYNKIWVFTMMAAKKRLYDCGAVGTGSAYYAMERDVTRGYPRTYVKKQCDALSSHK